MIRQIFFNDLHNISRIYLLPGHSLSHFIFVFLRALIKLELALLFFSLLNLTYFFQNYLFKIWQQLLCCFLSDITSISPFLNILFLHFYKSVKRKCFVTSLYSTKDLYFSIFLFVLLIYFIRLLRMATYFKNQS